MGLFSQFEYLSSSVFESPLKTNLHFLLHLSIVDNWKRTKLGSEILPFKFKTFGRSIFEWLGLLDAILEKMVAILCKTIQKPDILASFRMISSYNFGNSLHKTMDSKM